MFWHLVLTQYALSICFTLTCAIATPTFQQCTKITDGTGKGSQKCNMGPPSDWLAVSRDGAVKVHHLWKKDLVVWARRLDDLIEVLWLIYCPLSLFQATTISSVSQTPKDSQDTLAAILRPHHFLSLMCNTLQKAAENYTNLCNSVVSPELPVLKYSQMKRTDNHVGRVKALGPVLVVFCIGVSVVWLEALAREYELSDTNALN